MRGLIRAAMLAAAATAATCAPAGAAQFCVGETGTPCDGGTLPFTAAGLSTAIASASGAAGGDEVRIAAGTIPDVGSLTLDGADETKLVGAGSTTTTLAAAAGVGTLIAANGPAQLIDLELKGPASTGVLVNGGGTRIVERVRVSGMNQGLLIGSGSTTIRDVAIHLGATANATGVYALGAGAAAITAAVRRTTIGGTGDGQVGVRAINVGGGSSIAASVGESVVYLTGTGAHGLVCSRSAGSASLSASATAHTPAASYSSCTQAGPPNSAVDLSLAFPWFVNASAGDYRLQSFSPLIDRGAGFVLAGSIDALRLRRLVDGDGDAAAAVDLGAHEYQRAAPNPPVITMPVTTVAPGAAVTFTAAATDPDGEFPLISWDYGDGTPSGGAFHAYAALGTYTATVTATDPVGLTSTAQVAITVANPPALSDPANAATPTPPDPFATASGPRVRVLTPPGRSVKRTAAGFTTVSAGAPDVATLEVAGAPTLRVSLTRLVPGRRSRGRCRSTAKTGKRCTVRVPVSAIGQIPVGPGVVHLRFGGKLGGKRLAKGRYEVSVTPVGLNKRRGPAATYPLTLR